TDAMSRQEGRQILVLGDVLEIEPNSQLMHDSVGNFLDNKQIDALFTYGRESRHIHHTGQAFVNYAAHTTDKSEFIDSLKAYIEPQDKILIKGSRGMQLEEVVEALI